MSEGLVTAEAKEPIFTSRFLLVCATVFFNSFAFQILLPVIPLYLVDELGGAESQVGLIMGVAAISALVARPIVGYLADTVGRKPLLVAGPATYTLSAALYAVANAVPPLLAVRAIHGVGLSATTTGGSTYAADLAPASRRAEALGVYGASINVASAIGPFVGAAVAASIGFGTVFLISGIAATISLLLALRLPEVLAPDRPPPPALLAVESLFSRSALYPSMLAIFVTASFGAIISYLPVLADREGIGNPGLFFLPYSLTIIGTRLIAGRAADRFGREVTLVPGMVALSVGMLVIASATHISLFILAAVVYGIGFGTVHPTLMAMVVDRVEPQRQGVGMSTFTGAFDLGIGGGSALWGGVVLLFGLRGVFLAAAAAPLVALLILTVRRAPGQTRIVAADQEAAR